MAQHADLLYATAAPCTVGSVSVLTTQLQIQFPANVQKQKMALVLQFLSPM